MMIDKEATQPLALVVDALRTQRFAQLKLIADLTGKRFFFVYLEDEKRRNQRKGNQR